MTTWGARQDRNWSEAVTFTAILALAGVAVALLAWDARPPAAEPKRGFQELVGGLGFGPAVDLTQGPFRFDPRLCPAGTCDHELGPATLLYSPLRTPSALDYAPLLTGDPE